MLFVLEFTRKSKFISKIVTGVTPMLSLSVQSKIARECPRNFSFLSQYSLTLLGTLLKDNCEFCLENMNIIQPKESEDVKTEHSTHITLF